MSDHRFDVFEIHLWRKRSDGAAHLLVGQGGWRRCQRRRRWSSGGGGACGRLRRGHACLPVSSRLVALRFGGVGGVGIIFVSGRAELRRFLVVVVIFIVRVGLKMGRGGVGGDVD